MMITNDMMMDTQRIKRAIVSSWLREGISRIACVHSLQGSVLLPLSIDTKNTSL
jgi:hypothetical protein